VEILVPTYSYACTVCGHAFDIQQSFSDDSLTVCPECDGRLRKVFSSVGVVFKGSGFYRNDARAGAGKSGKSSAIPAASSADSSAPATSGSSSSDSSSSSTSSSSSGSSSSASSSGSSSGSSSSGSSSSGGSSSAPSAAKPAASA
jgi:putative FmdB family regulatory protein